MSRHTVYSMVVLLVLRALPFVLAETIARKEADVSPGAGVGKPVARKEADKAETSSKGVAHHAVHSASKRVQHVAFSVHAQGVGTVVRAEQAPTGDGDGNGDGDGASGDGDGSGDGSGDGGSGDGDGDGDGSVFNQCTGEQCLYDAFGDGGPAGSAVTTQGYMLDIQCYQRNRRGLPIPDGTDPRTEPWNHTRGCMLIPVCNTYYILRNTGTTAAPDYRAVWKLDDNGNRLARELLTNTQAQSNITVRAVGTRGANPGDLVVQNLTECSNCNPAPMVLPAGVQASDEAVGSSRGSVSSPNSGAMKDRIWLWAFMPAVVLAWRWAPV